MSLIDLVKSKTVDANVLVVLGPVVADWLVWVVVAVIHFWLVPLRHFRYMILHNQLIERLKYGDLAALRALHFHGLSVDGVLGAGVHLFLSDAVEAEFVMAVQAHWQAGVGHWLLAAHAFVFHIFN